MSRTTPESPHQLTEKYVNALRSELDCMYRVTGLLLALGSTLLACAVAVRGAHPEVVVLIGIPVLCCMAWAQFRIERIARKLRRHASLSAPPRDDAATM